MGSGIKVFDFHLLLLLGSGLKLCFLSHNPDAFNPSWPHLAVRTLHEELVDRVTVVHLEDEEAAHSEAVVRAKCNRVANLDIVLHCFALFPLE